MAFGASKLDSVKGWRFSIKVKQYEKDGFHSLAKVVFRMVQLFLDQPTLVRVARNTGVEFAEFDPAFFIGDYEPRVQLEATVTQKKQSSQKEALELYQLLMQVAPNQDAVNKIMLPKIGDVVTSQDVEAMFSAPEQIDQLGDQLPQDVLPVNFGGSTV